MKKTKTKRFALILLALVMIFLSYLLSTDNVGEMLSEDKEIDNNLMILELYFIRVILFILGVLLIFKKSSDLIERFFHSNRKEILLLIIIIILTIFLSEVILRIFDINFNRYKTRDEVYHHLLIPNSFGMANALEYKSYFFINSFGLRDREYELKKPKDKYRIMMLGDSFTEGLGVQINETFSKIIEKKLNSKLNLSNLSFEVINAGVESYSPMSEYLWMKNKGILLEPDLVVLNYDNTDIGGDVILEKVSTFDIYGNLLAIDGTKDNSYENALFERVKSKKFYLFEYIKNFHELFTKNNLTKTIKNSVQFPKFFYEGEFDEERCFKWMGWNNLTADKDTLLFTRDKFPDQELKNYVKSLEYVKKLKNFLDTKNISLLLIAYPYGHQVSTKEWKLGRTFRCADQNKVYSINSCNFLEDYAVKNNILVFNSCPLFREYGSNDYGESDRLYYELDGHFTKKGHEFFSEILYKFIIKKIIKNDSII